MADPEPPQGARLVFPGGEELPIEWVYNGIDNRGMHHWKSTVTWRVGIDQAQFHANKIPARTAISIEIATDGG